MRGPERTPNLYCFHVKLPLKKTQDAGRNAGGTGGRAGGLRWNSDVCGYVVVKQLPVGLQKADQLDN
jgi:hypothetical protein